MLGNSEVKVNQFNTLKNHPGPEEPEKTGKLSPIEGYMMTKSKMGPGMDSGIKKKMKY